MNICITDLFDLNHTQTSDYLKNFKYPWEALAELKNYILTLISALDRNQYNVVAENVWVHRTAKIAPTAFLGAPCIVGAETEVRHCAFVRGSAIIGKNCVVGNSVEIKNAILFDNVQVPHFNYVGDSILGFHAHLGAGAVTSNIKADKKNIVIHADTPIETGLRKCGAMLGDFADIGCNSVLNPGAIVGRRTSVYPCSCVRGVIPQDCIYKTGGIIVQRENNE